MRCTGKPPVRPAFPMNKPGIDTDRLQRINTLLAEALALPEAERGAWLRALKA